mmetsp:Transcript_39972/g.93350  ORF Transcript_39972/g.93350 Transcript_39972/m.93350 type:complete len:217 (+) Transcript_39972:69-719(+)
MPNATCCLETKTDSLQTLSTQPVPYLSSRVMLRVTPSLQPPSVKELRSWLDNMAPVLGIAPNRFVPIEVSITGAYLLFDVHPLDTYNDHEVAILGPKVFSVIQLISTQAHSASGLTAYGRQVDSRSGIWIVDGSLSHEATRIEPSREARGPKKGPSVRELLSVLLLAIFIIGLCRLWRCWEMQARPRMRRHVGSVPVAVHDTGFEMDADNRPRSVL